jgi:hypothetical protein
MQPLLPPDTHCLSAAIGWFELGNPDEAELELGHIRPACQHHPDVLEVRWLICAELQRWDQGLEVARQLVANAPERVSGWLHQAYALRRAPGGSIQKAWDALLPAAQKFPTEPIIPFNLACYAAQLHQLDTARTWLQQAMTLGEKAQIKQMALRDSDLETLWPEIRAL